MIVLKGGIMKVQTRIKGVRCFKRGDIYWVEINRKRSSLRTKDPQVAQIAINEIERRIEEGHQVELRRRLGKATLGDFKEKYLNTRKNGYSTKTYKMDITAFNSFIEIFGAEFKLRDLTAERIEQYKSRLLEDGVRPTSINSYLRHMKAALGVAVEWGFLQRRPKIKFLKTGQPLPRVLSPQEIKKLLKVAKKSHKQLYPYIVFYLYTGCRRSEALNLETVQLTGKTPHVKVVGKGNKERIVPLLPPVVEVLKTMELKSVHPDTLTHWFEDLAKECEIKARLHDLRHSAATYMLASGIDLPVVQKILGHSQISTTQVYAKVLEEQVHKQMKKLKFDL